MGESLEKAVATLVPAFAFPQGSTSGTFSLAFSAQMSAAPAAPPPGTLQQAQTMATLQVLLQATEVLCSAWAALLGGGYPNAYRPSPPPPPPTPAWTPPSGTSAFGFPTFHQGGSWGAAAAAFAGSFQPGYGTSVMGDWNAAMAASQAFPYGPSQGAQASASLALNFGYQHLPGESVKMWDVWFDSKQGQNTVQRSPLVLDLNKNGKADITGKNITGDGKIDGPTTLFDLDPNSVSYEFKSQQRRPGSGAPAAEGGHWVDGQGNRVTKGPPKGTQKGFNGYKYLDKDGNVVGEMRDGLYNYGKQEKREATEWLAKNGGDGFLAADLNGDGQINSAVELFGTEGTNGQKYQNGYEKLAALYDKNHDGQVNGNELQGLQIWADSNADGQVQQGEMRSLAQYDITSLNVGQYDRTSMEGSLEQGGREVPYLNFALALAGGMQIPVNVPNGFFANNPFALPPRIGVL